MKTSFAPFWVTAGKGIVHAAGCPHLRRARSATVWGGSNVFPHDRPCRHCLPDGLPEDPT